ncbi:pilus assembly protein PilP [Agarivorans gilvus]|jgi:type IV pilus assembly protein PilP|uniref:Pilus biosynthesis protein PilP n=1 Tax=Agarivorans gilvus TaxID=680279 RepID=A0ABQ1I719_9ALTE|nr:pilus assembly protein PilP [Agarivorans gilvus]GGB19627.1 pilus biosynthesis protein PilP [Agarivorans gilvus]
MKAIVLGLTLLALFGCEGSKDDLQQYVMEVKARKVPVQEDVPQIKPFEHLAYQASDGRNPFTSPAPEAVDTTVSDEKECALAPQTNREKQALEQYSLSSLKMRGVLGDGPSLWALLEVPGGEMYRVKEGYYLGLHHGVIVKVSDTGLDIKEVVSDGQGCWNERTTQLSLSQAEQ